MRLKPASFTIAGFCVHQKVEEGQTHFRVEAYLWKPLSPITDAVLSVVTKMFWVLLFKYFSLFNLWNPLSAMTEAGLEQGQGEEPSDSPADGCNKFSQILLLVS